MNFTNTNSSGATLYHCSCGPPVASTSYHKLPSLYFCEECDSIQCPECVLEEVSSYYCPNCLFEVPSASVRAEKNRCARNCFLCPCCSNTLAVVPSDPSDPSVAANPLSPQASVGEPPYSLSCLACRWDSKVVGITFDKPTGLAAQLQKLDDSSSASNEYESIREHLEPWLKAGLSAAQAASHHSQKTPHLSSHRPTNAIAAAARALSHSNSTMSREIPSSIASASRFNSLHNLAAMHRSSSLRSGLGKLDATSAANQKDELEPYQSRQKTEAKPAETELARARALKSVSSLEQLSKVEQKRYLSASQPNIMNDLLPQRIPLRSKRTKRCPTCKHIVVKPDTKAASTRFRIRLVASNYLPQIDVHRRVPPSLGTRLSAVGATSVAGSASASRRGRTSTSGHPITTTSGVETLIAIGSAQDLSEPLRPGRNFSFQLTFTNPLYEAVDVMVELSDPLDAADGDDEDRSLVEEGARDRSVSSTKPANTTAGTWNISMPATSFGINAFAEEWEYEGEDDESEDVAGESGTTPRSHKFAPGILAKKANKTAVQLDLSVGRDASGPVKVPLYVTYTYTAEDPLASGGGPATAKSSKNDPKALISKEGAVPTHSNSILGAPQQQTDGITSSLKTFSFWTNVPLGHVVPRAGGGSTSNVINPQARRVASTNNPR